MQQRQSVKNSNDLEYIQVLLQNKGKYQLTWIPTIFAIKNKRLSIKGDLPGPWVVKEVYDKAEEIIDEGGRVRDVEEDKKSKVKGIIKIIWRATTKPILSGEDLRERLNSYRKMKRLVNITEWED